MKEVLSTGQAAKLCYVSQQTIIRCCDNGSLKSFKVPGSKFRRIRTVDLCAYMEANGIPTDLIDAQFKKQVVVEETMPDGKVHSDDPPNEAVA